MAARRRGVVHAPDPVDEFLTDGLGGHAAILGNWLKFAIVGLKIDSIGKKERLK